MTEPGLVLRPEIPGFPSKIRLLGNTNTIPIPVPLEVTTSLIKVIHGNANTLARSDEPHVHGKIRGNPDSTN